jgi:hypothetical protein
MTRVVLLDGGTLLGAGLAEILAQDETLQVERISHVDMAGLLRVLNDRRPDVIVLTEESPLEVTRLLDLMEVIPTNDRLRVIIVRHHDNTVDLYDKRQVKILQSQDVFKLIHTQTCVA